MFVAYGFRITVGSYFFVEPASRVKAMRLSRKRQSPLAETIFKKTFIEFCEVADPLNTEVVQVLLHYLADAWYLSHRKWRKEVRLFAAGNPKHTVGLSLIGSNFGDQSRSTDPDRTVELSFCFHLLVKCMCGGQRRPVQTFGACHLKVGFVNGSHLDLRRVTPKHLAHF